MVTYNRKSLGRSSKLHRLMEILSLQQESRSSSEHRVKALMQLQHLIQASTFTERSSSGRFFLPGGEDIMDVMKLFVPCLMTQVAEPRSKVVQQSTNVLTLLSYTLGSKFRPYAESIFANLTMLSSENTKHAKYIQDCVVSILRNTYCPRCIEVGVDLTDPQYSKQIRTQAATYLTIMIGTWSAGQIRRFIPKFEIGLRNVLGSPSRSLRSSGQEMWEQFQSHWPDDAARVFDSFAPVTQRVLADNHVLPYATTDPSAPHMPTGLTRPTAVVMRERFCAFDETLLRQPADEEVVTVYNLKTMDALPARSPSAPSRSRYPPMNRAKTLAHIPISNTSPSDKPLPRPRTTRRNTVTAAHWESLPTDSNGLSSLKIPALKQSPDRLGNSSTLRDQIRKWTIRSDSPPSSDSSSSGSSTPPEERSLVNPFVRRRTIATLFE